MIVIFGTRMYGKVDQVPGLFHLATEFFHAEFVPLVPVRSYLVMQPDGRPVPLGLSGKSVLFAYLRVVLLVGGVMALITGLILSAGGLAGHNEHLAAGLLASGVGIAGLLLFFFSYRFSRPSPLRAYRLASKAGLPMQVLAEYYAKRLTPEELEVLARHLPAGDETSTPYESHL